MDKKYLVVVIVVLVLLGLAQGFKKGEKGKHKREAEEESRKKSEMMHSNAKPTPPPPEMKVDVTFRPEECLQKTRVGDTIEVHYTGKLEDGTVFDSSIPRGSPFSFKIGTGQVIPGWERGLQGMCVGERRKLVIPHQYAYGEAGYPPVIPPSSTLYFEVELISITE